MIYDSDTCYDKNVDYKKMYLIMMNAAEKAMNILIAAQKECEEIYINAGEDGVPPTDL